MPESTPLSERLDEVRHSLVPYDLNVLVVEPDDDSFDRIRVGLKSPRIYQDVSVRFQNKFGSLNIDRAYSCEEARKLVAERDYYALAIVALDAKESRAGTNDSHQGADLIAYLSNVDAQTRLKTKIIALDPGEREVPRRLLLDSGRPVPIYPRQEESLIEILAASFDYLNGQIVMVNLANQYCDALTALNGRGSFDAYCNRLYAELVRGRQRQSYGDNRRRDSRDEPAREELAFTAAMLDLNRFKQFNDTYGHQVGDEVLRLFAKSIRSKIPDKQVFRYGGEEIVVVFEDVPPRVVKQRILELDALVRSTNYSVDGVSTPLSISFSTGMCSSTDANKIIEKTLQGIVDAADKALYLTKSHGRRGVTTCYQLRCIQSLERALDSLMPASDEDSSMQNALVEGLNELHRWYTDSLPAEAESGRDFNRSVRSVLQITSSHTLQLMAQAVEFAKKEKKEKPCVDHEQQLYFIETFAMQLFSVFDDVIPVKPDEAFTVEGAKQKILSCMDGLMEFKIRQAADKQYLVRYSYECLPELEHTARSIISRSLEELRVIPHGHTSEGLATPNLDSVVFNEESKQFFVTFACPNRYTAEKVYTRIKTSLSKELSIEQGKNPGTNIEIRQKRIDWDR